jgi:hypothetical protein
VVRAWRAPICRATRRRLNGEVLDRAARTDAYRAILAFPRRASLLRVALFTAVAATVGGVFGARTGFSLVVITASNGVETDAVQNFTLNVNEAPQITSANSTSCVTLSPCSFTVTTTGFPLPTIVRTGDALPSALNFVQNGDGTATLTGTAGAGTAGVYHLTFTASNSVLPDAVQAFTLTVNGFGFHSGAQIQWNGQGLDTTFVNDAELTAHVTPGINPLLAHYPGSATITALDTNGITATATLVITVPRPVLIRIDPVGARAGSPDTTVTLSGESFVSDAVVTWNSLHLTTTFVSSGRLSAVIPAPELAHQNIAQVAVAQGSHTVSVGTSTYGPKPTPASISSSPQT